MEEEENDLTINSEIRYIALELMKLAQKSGKSFKEISEEYLKNTYSLQKLIATENEGKPQQFKEYKKQKADQKTDNKEK